VRWGLYCSPRTKKWVKRVEVDEGQAIAILGGLWQPAQVAE